MFQATPHRPLPRTAAKQEPSQVLLRAPKAQQRDPDRPAEPWMEHLELVRDALFRLRDVPMAFHFSPRDFRKVYCKLDLETKKHNRFSYDAQRRELIVQCMPRIVHEEAVHLVGEAIRSELSLSLPDAPWRVYGAYDYDDFTGAKKGSEAQADILVCLRGRYKVDARCAVEVGVSQSQTELVRKARLWLNHTPTVVSVLLVNVEEFPLYSSLVKRVQDDELELMNSEDLDAYFDAHPDMPPFGPVRIHGLTWAGEVQHVWVELWMRNDSGAAHRVGNAIDLLDTLDTSPLEYPLQLLLGDDVALSDPNSTVTISRDRLRTAFHWAMPRLARSRYKVTRRLAGQEDEVISSEYDSDEE